MSPSEKARDNQQVVVHVHNYPDPALHAKLDRLDDKLTQTLTKLEQQGVVLMGLKEDLTAANEELAQINEVTNEIAADVEDLVQQAADAPANSAAAAEALAKATAIKARLQEIAAKHTPGTSEPPVV